MAEGGGEASDDEAHAGSASGNDLHVVCGDCDDNAIASAHQGGRRTRRTTYHSLLLLFPLSNVFAYVFSQNAKTRDTVDAVHTYFYVHPWSPQALQYIVRLDRSTAPTCSRPLAQARAPTHELTMLHPHTAHASLCAGGFRR